MPRNLEQSKKIKATSHLMIFMRGKRTLGKIQSQDGQRRPSFAGKKLLVSLIPHTNA